MGAWGSIRIVVAVAVAALAAAAGGTGASAHVAPELGRAVDAKPKPRVCRTVTKVVRGKRRKVRVCKAAKRKPKPPAQAQPRDVSLGLDAARAASATVGAAGGTVAATSADGTRLTLVIPEGALAADTTITATPVASLGGVPAGVRVLGAVQLAPDGLALATPATLTIELRNAATPTGFAWFGAGADVHRYPVSRSGATLTLRITHFSGAGAVSGPAGWLPTAETALSLRFARDVRPLMRAAETDDAQLGKALDEAFGWEREVELLGLGERFATWKAEIRAWLPRAFANALENASAKCAAHDLTQIDRMLALERKAQQLGLTVPGESAFERARKCAHFELDVEYRQTASFHNVTETGSHTMSTDLAVKATVPIALTSRLEGEAPLEVVGWSYAETITSNQSDPPFRCDLTAISAAPARNLRVALELDVAAVATGGTPAIALLVTPGAVSLTRSGCMGSGANSGDADVPQAFAGDGAVPGTITSRIALAPPFGRFVGADVYASYGPETTSGTAPGGMQFSLTRTFVLRHTPQR